MTLAELTNQEREIVHRCLRVAADDPAFFPDWEFHTLFGVTRPEFVALVDQWPALDESSEDVRAAISNAMNNLLGYPHGQEKRWSSLFEFSTDDLLRVFAKWGKSQLAR